MKLKMKLKTRFQDEDFDLGEVVEANIYNGGNRKIKVIAEPAKGGRTTFYFGTLKELNEAFEDYKGPEEYWSVACGMAARYTWSGEEWDRAIKAVGLKFDTKEECERAIAKMEAWHKLTDHWGTEILGWEIRDMPTGGNWQTVNVKLNVKARKEPMELLDICFGGEE